MSNAEKFGQILREGMAEQDRKDAHDAYNKGDWDEYVQP